jgi:tetratricopeptide (TPR) repeat protein
MVTPFYISRPSAEQLETQFAQALGKESSSYLIFHILGVGGVGKSTLTNKLAKDHAQQADFLRISFGETEQIGNPIEVMKKFYDFLPDIEQVKAPLLQRDLLKGNILKADPFLSLYQKYWDTIHELQSTPILNEKSVTAEQSEVVKQLISMGAGGYFTLSGMPVLATAAGKTGEVIHSIATGILTEKDRIGNLLDQHKKTKKDRELKELMLAPIPKLTAAFVEGLANRKKPVVLTFDTYEKVTPDIDNWLWQSLIANTKISQSKIKLVISGRRNLLKTECWRKLQQDHNYICVQGLDRFDEPQTQAYLNQIPLTDETQQKQIFTVTKGLPYYLDWISRQIQAGFSLDFSQGNQEIAQLLLQGLTESQKRLIQLAACCRWFDRGIIREILASQSAINFEDNIDGYPDAMEWLQNRDFVEYVQGKYRLDDVARDVFREGLWQEDRQLFQQVNQQLAQYFQTLADSEIFPDSSPRQCYENEQWCDYIAEGLYYGLYGGTKESLGELICRFLESFYFSQYEVSWLPIVFIKDELNLGDNQSFLLLNLLKKELSTIFNYLVSNEPQKLWEYCYRLKSSLSDLAELSLYLNQSKYALPAHKLDYLQQAFQQAETLQAINDQEFLSDLYLWKIGDSFYNLEAYENAIASYDEALKIKPDKHEAWNNRGTTLFNLGRLEEAIASYDEALKIKPDKHEAWNNRGTTLFNLGRLEEVIASYDEALKFKPDDHEVWYNRGIALRQLGRYEEVIASYDEALKIKPDDHEAWNNRGTTLFNLGRLEEAIASYDEALKFKPDDHEVWYNRGIALRQLGRYEEVIASYDEALKIKPDDHNAWVNRGINLRQLGRLEEAITSFDEALKIKPDYHEVWYDRGIALRQLGRNEEAIVSYDEALKFKPDDYETWYKRGIALSQLGRLEEAITSSDEALKIKPDDHEAWYFRGIVLGQLGRLEEAIASFDEALKIKPDDPETLRYRELALAYLMKLELEKQINTYDQLLNSNPNDHETWETKASFLYLLGRYEEAILSYNKSLEILPNNGSSYFNKACIYSLQENIDLAIENLTQAIKLDSKYLEMAKTDTDFDKIRHDSRFINLLNIEH